jgi:hypothetical protein
MVAIDLWKLMGSLSAFMTLGLNAGKECGGLITTMGTGGQHICQMRAERCPKKDVQSTEVDCGYVEETDTKYAAFFILAMEEFWISLWPILLTAICSGRSA